MSEKPKNWIPFEEFYETMGKRPVGAAVLLRDETGKILMLKSTYRDGWVFPGGLSDGDESPKETAQRETFEEIRLQKDVKRLLHVEHNLLLNGRAGLVFIFDAGIVTESEIKKIVLDEENSEYCFMEFEEAVAQATVRYKNRIKYAMKALETGSAYYAEEDYSDGE